MKKEHTDYHINSPLTRPVQGSFYSPSLYWLNAEFELVLLKIFWFLVKLLQVRKLEMLIALLVFTMAACFFGEMSYVKPPASDVLKGMFVPKLSGQGATGSAVALLGALVMP